MHDYEADSQLDRDLEDTGEYNIASRREQVKLTIKGAAALGLITGLAGFALAFTNGSKLGDARAAYSAGNTLIVCMFVMLIAVGALTGHLTLFRLILKVARRVTRLLRQNLEEVRALREEIAELRGQAAKNREAIGVLLEENISVIRGRGGH